MKKTRKANRPQSLESIAQTALEGDIAAIQQQVANGEPLKLHQRRLLESALNGNGDGFALNQSALAEALGVARQLICWHAGKPNSPKPRKDGRHDIAAWRRYLASIGRAGFQAPAVSNQDIAAENAICGTFYYLSGVLPTAVEKSLTAAGITVSREQRDALVFHLWLTLAGQVDATLEADGHGPLFFSEDGETEYPRAIQEIAARLASAAESAQL